MADSILLSDLNPRQQIAVKQTEGPVLVLAGAGSGKTRVLTYRIAYIMEKGLAAPDEILAVTFTNKAAREMKRRIEELINIPVQPLWIGTFHSISARILHREGHLAGYQSNFTIYDVDDQVNQIKRIMDFLNIDKELLSPKHIQYVISQAKNNLQDARQFEKISHDFQSRKITQVFLEYEIALRRNNAFDFDDLLVTPIDIFTSHQEVLEKYQKKFKYILIDEYQDTNKAQYYWVKLLSGKHHNLCVVGDEDQSIYGWRGADIENILRFEQDFPKCKLIRLEQNYRSTKTILNAANSVVAHNLKRLGKNLWSDLPKGDPIIISLNRDEVEEASRLVEFIQKELADNQLSRNDIVVLYRTNTQSRAIEEQLRRSAIPYTIVGGIKFYERKEIKDILAYLRVIVNPNDTISLLRIINFPSRGIGNNTVGLLNQYAHKNKISLFEAIQQVEKIEGLTPAYLSRVKLFYEIIEKYRSQLENFNAFEIVEKIIEEVGIKKLYENSDQVEDQARIENINELLNSLDIFVSNHPEADRLINFLDEVSLLTDIDRWNSDFSSVTLMTLHSVKGLEFEVVFITGVEDGLLPHSRSQEKPEDLEEERRLFYVGLTRAQKRLYLLHAQMRHRFLNGEFGSGFRSIPSRFLKEIPDEFTIKYSFESKISKHYQTRFKFERKLDILQSGASPAVLPDESSDYKIGQYVEHELFGRGQILGVDSAIIGTKLTIQFANRNLKKIIAEYANLKICDNREQNV
jgi:DNA helicase-2/ATP-dependent DNA helicase PcrA